MSVQLFYEPFKVTKRSLKGYGFNFLIAHMVTSQLKLMNQEGIMEVQHSN